MAEQDRRDEPRDETVGGARDETVDGHRDETRHATGGTWAGGGHTPSQPYTIHGDAMADPGDGAAAPARTRGGPDPIALVAGLVALVLAALGATGTLDAVDPRWVLAAGAVLVGATVLGASLRRRT